MSAPGAGGVICTGKGPLPLEYGMECSFSRVVARAVGAAASESGGKEGGRNEDGRLRLVLAGRS